MYRTTTHCVPISPQSVLIITGQRKALALSKCIEEGVNHLWTVSAIQLHPWALVCCDRDATMELRVKTVEYFRSIESAQEEVEVLQAKAEAAASSGKMRNGSGLGNGYGHGREEEGEVDVAMDVGRNGHPR